MIELIYSKERLKKAIDNIEGMYSKLNDALYQAVSATVMEIQTKSKEYSPYKSGTLRRSIDKNVERSAQQIIGKVGTNVVYARIQELGGTTGIKKSVVIKAKHYLTRAIQEIAPKLNDKFRKLMAIKKL